MTSSLRAPRAALAALAILAALVTSASPSSAATTNVTWDVAFHYTTHWDGVTHLIPDPFSSPVCVPTPAAPTMVTHVNDTTHSLHMSNSTAWSTTAIDVAYLGGNFQWVISGANSTTTGIYNGANGTFTLATALRVDWKNCAGTTTLCTFNLTLHLNGTDYDGDTLPVTGDTVTVTGSSAPINPAIGCNPAIRPSILNSTISLALHLTAH